VRIAVAAPQVPFVRGGAELMADDLVAALQARGHEAELVTVPFKWYPGTRVLDQAFLWRLVDLTESDGRPIDRVIATKFPAYCVRHPNKVAWVLHQFRQAYDYDRTELGQFSESPEDRATRAAVQRLDGVVLVEARRVFATSRNIADRLRRFNGIEAEVLPHPPQSLSYREEEPEGYVLYSVDINRRDDYGELYGHAAAITKVPGPQSPRDLGIRVETGEFGAAMQVELVNDGPVTIVVDI